MKNPIELGLIKKRNNLAELLITISKKIILKIDKETKIKVKKLD